MIAFHKFVVLVFLGLVVPIATFSQIRYLWPISTSTIVYVLAGTVVLFLIYVSLGGWALDLKNVELCDRHLVISTSNIFSTKKVVVQLEDIDDVYQRFWQRGKRETVTIKFIRSTEFGTQISFIPKMRFLGFLEHPVVNELRAQINLHRTIGTNK